MLHKSEGVCLHVRSCRLSLSGKSLQSTLHLIEQSGRDNYTASFCKDYLSEVIWTRAKSSWGKEEAFKLLLPAF